MALNEHQEKALSLLQPLVLDAHKMILKPKAKTPKDSRFCSHFNGDPYFEPGEQWPTVSGGKSKKSDPKPYDFIFQVVNDGTIGLPKDIALFQFYYNWELMPWDTKDKGWLVKTYRKINRTNGITIKSPPENDSLREFDGVSFRPYCGITFKPIRMLPDWDSIDDYVPKRELTKLCKKINDDEPWEAYNQLCKKLKIATEIESCCGGYPQWVQGNEAKGRKLVFQAGCEEDTGFQWEDDGRIYLFFDPTNEKAFHFVLQCY